MLYDIIFKKQTILYKFNFSFFCSIKNKLINNQCHKVEFENYVCGFIIFRFLPSLFRSIYLLDAFMLSKYALSSICTIWALIYAIILP